MDEWTSPNGVWRIHHPDGWMIENLKSGFGDSPIVYEDGKVAFDHPEQLPEYVKNRFRYMVRYPEDLTDNTPNPDIPPKARKPHLVKAQRTRFGMPLGAIIAISAEDLPFVGPDVEYLEVKMRPCAAALHITVTVADVGERP